MLRAAAIIVTTVCAVMAEGNPSLRGAAPVDGDNGVQIGRVVFTGPLGTLVNGVPADYCMRMVNGLGQDCGQPAADAFCRGVDPTAGLRAVSFARAKVNAQTWLQGDQKMNNGGNQDGFSSITCNNSETTVDGSILGSASAVAVAAAEAVVDLLPRARAGSPNPQGRRL